MNPLISVITPSIYTDGLKLVSDCLQTQTDQDFEWIVVSPEDTPDLIPHLYIEEPNPNPGDIYNLNKAFNTAIRHCRGDLIVSWNDWVYAHSKFLQTARIIHGRLDDSMVTYPVDSYDSDHNHKHNLLWHDYRRDLRGVQVHDWQVDWNLLTMPIQAVYDVGGFDEALDRYYGLPEVSVNLRISHMNKYNFLCYAVNAYHVRHSKPALWDECSNYNGYFKERMEQLKSLGKWPVLDYLVREEVLV